MVRTAGSTMIILILLATGDAAAQQNGDFQLDAADLQTWAADRHPRVVYSVKPRPMPAAGELAPGAGAAEKESARSRNFGFHALERPTGNIGYLEMGRFEPPALAGATLAAAMQFLHDTDALIID